MNISQTFIERPIATSLLMAAIALFGAVAYRALPVSDLPNVDLPTLLVTASLPGASPETMAAAVATPLENQFSTIAGMNSMSSTNSLGNTQITLEFDLAPAWARTSPEAHHRRFDREGRGGEDEGPGDRRRTVRRAAPADIEAFAIPCSTRLVADTNRPPVRAEAQLPRESDRHAPASRRGSGA